jgi:hypothetical protein
MRSFSFVLSLALLSFCVVGLTGCGEDNEAASRDAAAKNAAPVDPTKGIAQSKTMEDYAKNNPGSRGVGVGAGKAAGYPGAKK